LREADSVRRKGRLSPEEYLGLRLGIAANFVGFIVSGVLLLNHLEVADASFCTVGDAFSCNVVNRSPYSVVWGIPVALIGMVGFLAVAALSALRLVRGAGPGGRLTPPFLTAAVVAGLAFGAYLVFVELSLLHIVCLLCAVSLALFVGASLALRKSLTLPGPLQRARGRGRAPADGD
jgi:uncharacterized membrane protein